MENEIQILKAHLKNTCLAKSSIVPFDLCVALKRLIQKQYNDASLVVMELHVISKKMPYLFDDSAHVAVESLQKQRITFQCIMNMPELNPENFLEGLDCILEMSIIEKKYRRIVKIAEILAEPQLTWSIRF